MNKRPLAGCAILYCGGIWAASVRPWYAYLIAAAMVSAVLISFFCGLFRTHFRSGVSAAKVSQRQTAFHGKRILPSGACVIIVCFFVFPAAGFLLSMQAQADSRWYETYDFDNCSAAVSGEVCEIEEEDGVQTVRIRDVTMTYDGRSYQTNDILIRTYFDDISGEMPSFDDLRIGNRIRVIGTVSYFSSARNPGNFDAREYYRIQGIDFRVTPQTLSITDYGVRHFAESLRQLRIRLRTVLSRCLPEDAYGVLCTMILGDDSVLSDETETLYQEAGISHILAISGLHVSIVGMMLYRLLRRRGISYLFSSIPAGFLVLSFGVMTGMGIAVQRAIIMYFVMLTADLFGWAYDSLSALSLAAILILTNNPLLLFSASFQLSFTAVLGTSVFFPLLKSYVRSKYAFSDSFLLALSIQLATIPVTLYYYYEIPVFSLIANLILVPFVSVVLIDGIAGALIGLVCLKTACIALLPSAVILQGYAFACSLIGQIPGHMLICGRPSWGRIFLYYTVLAAALLQMHRRVKMSASGSDKRQHLLRGITGRLLPSAVLMAVLLGCMALHLPESFRITMLDVGQGDGILIESDGVNVFLDGGSSDVTDVGTWRIEPYLKYSGISVIDLWMVTHTDSDHISGLQNLLKSGYRIRYLAFAAGVYQDEDTAELIALAQSAGTEVLYLPQGSSVTQGNAVWTVLYPEDENCYSDKNEASLVLLLEYRDFTALFTGDMTEDSEADLLSGRYLTKYLSRTARTEGIDLLKVAHHGSSYSSAADFLEAISPQAAIISAGVDNMYGHPSEETLLRLREYTQEIYVTSEEGAIFVTPDADGEMQFETFLK